MSTKRELCGTEGQPMQWPEKSGGCKTCDWQIAEEFRSAGDWMNAMSRPFIVCVVCGNKRCPKATDHNNDCTGSNEPGQTGSAYPAFPPIA